MNIYSLKIKDKVKDNFPAETYNKLSKVVQSANMMILCMCMLDPTDENDERLINIMKEYPGGKEHFEKERMACENKDLIKILEYTLKGMMPEDESELPLPKDVASMFGAMIISGQIEIVDSAF